MAILDAIRKAILRTDGSVVTEVYSSADQICVEMADLANDVAIDIVKGHDWRKLTKLHTMAGNGVTEDFPLPADYDRMVLASEIDDMDMWFWGYCNIPTINEWLELKNSGFVGLNPGGWIMIGGNMSFMPAPTGTAVYPYISNLYARDEDGNPKAQFDRDTDTFVLDERLITLGCIWRWFEQKHMPVDTSEYDLALSQAQARDKGARTVTNRRKLPYVGSRIAWPWSLG